MRLRLACPAAATAPLSRLALILALGLSPGLLAAAAGADPVRYALEDNGSRVEFLYTLNGQKVTGRMKAREADVWLDLRDIGASHVSVVLDAAGADAGLPFATEAMRGASVLDVAHNPEIRFVSTAIRGDVNAAEVQGRLTLRGVTRPVRFQAQVYRAPGSAAGDHRQMSVLLTGAIRRSDFGATGYDGLVGDPITIRVLARLEAAG